MGIFNSRFSKDSTTWFRLDNAAKIYPAVSNSVRTSVFRLKATLTEPIKIIELQEALDTTLEELPYFRSQLKQGFFWYWLEPSDARPKIQLDEGLPCRSFLTSSTNHLLFRVLASHKTLSIEFMHVLTDGGGAMEFFRTLLRNYGQKLDWFEQRSQDSKKVQDAPDAYNDAYKTHFNKTLPKPQKLSLAYHLPFYVKRKPTFNLTAIQLDVQTCLKRARSYKISLTEYMTSVYLFVLQSFYEEDKNRKKKSILRVQVPVNLRKIFKSGTLRNFALFVMPEIDMRLGSYSFEEIASIVHHYMQLETDKRQIQRIITRNVGGEKNLIIRALPLYFKIPALYFAYKFSGPKLYSGVMTNLGAVKVDEECSKHIHGFAFIAPPPDKSIRVNAALISYQDDLVLNFGNQSLNNAFERRFIQFLIGDGIPVKLVKTSL